MTRISKRIRAEAARIASIRASTPSMVIDTGWSPAAVSLYSRAFWFAYGRPIGGEYESPYDIRAHEAGAEAEALLRTGWTP